MIEDGSCGTRNSSSFFADAEDYVKRCVFVIDRTRGSNLFIFGDQVLFEGFATTPEGNYDTTIKYTDSDILSIRIKIFDELFKAAGEDTIRRFGPPGGGPRETRALQEAVICGIETAKRNLEEKA